jgi:hypothetical protein
MYAASTDTRSSPENTTSEWGLGKDVGQITHSAEALCLSSTGQLPQLATALAQGSVHPYPSLYARHSAQAGVPRSHLSTQAFTQLQVFTQL